MFEFFEKKSCSNRKKKIETYVCTMYMIKQHIQTTVVGGVKNKTLKKTVFFFK